MDSVERFAKIRAAIEAGGDRDRALREAVIAPAEWIRLQRRWLDALADEIASGGDALATRYCQAFAGAPPAAAEEPAAAQVPPPVEVATAIPSFLKAAPAPIPAAPVPDPSALAAQAPAAPAPRRPRSTLLGTEPSHTPAVPFHGGTAPPEIAIASGPPAAPRIPSGTGLALNLPIRPATPFHKDNVPAPATPADPHGFTLARYAELVAARDSSDGDIPAVLAELGIDIAQHDAIEAHWRRRMAENGMLALDFGRLYAQAKQARPARAAHPPSASPPAAVAPRPVGTGTALSVEVPREALPFQRTATATASPAARPALPELTVEQYAWLVATLRRTAPADLPAVLARFQLTAETRKDLEAHWASRMSGDPALKEAFLAALGHYLRGGGG